MYEIFGFFGEISLVVERKWLCGYTVHVFNNMNLLNTCKFVL